MSLPIIKIIGEAGSGKSTIACLIRQALGLYGITANITGCEDERPEDIATRWHTRLSSLYGQHTTIEIVRQSAGESSQSTDDLVQALKGRLEDCVGSLEALQRFAPPLLCAAGVDLDDEEWITVAGGRAARARVLLQSLSCRSDSGFVEPEWSKAASREAARESCAAEDAAFVKKVDEIVSNQ